MLATTYTGAVRFTPAVSALKWAYQPMAVRDDVVAGKVTGAAPPPEPSCAPKIRSSPGQILPAVLESGPHLAVWTSSCVQNLLTQHRTLPSSADDIFVLMP